MDHGKAASIRPKLNLIPNYGDASEAPAARFPARRAVVMAAGAVAVLTLVPLTWSLVRGSAQEAASASSPQAVPHNEENGLMAVHDDNGEMVGQLAKMPGDTERGLQVESVSRADRNSGKELMKIIGKY